MSVEIVPSPEVKKTMNEEKLLALNLSPSTVINMSTEVFYSYETKISNPQCDDGTKDEPEKAQYNSLKIVDGKIIITEKSESRELEVGCSDEVINLASSQSIVDTDDKTIVAIMLSPNQ